MFALQRILLLLIPGVVLVACSTLTLENVNFGWPVESVVTVNRNGSFEELRYGVSASVTPIAVSEFQDSTALGGTQLRLLRSAEGYYFITGPRFHHVYVFAPGPRQLTMTSSIEVSKDGLKNPALNQRPPHVELVDDAGFVRLLTSTDIVESKK